MALFAVAALLSVIGVATWLWLLRTPVLVVTVARAEEPPRPGSAGAAVLQATGYIVARRQATVSAQITGMLSQVLIEEGDRVLKGQVLARLDDSALRAALKVTQSGLKIARAQVDLAQAQWLQARADLTRQTELLTSGMVSKQAAEQARTAMDSAAAQLEARRLEVDSAQAQLTQAQVTFDYAVIRAPFAGIVVRKAAQVGEVVSPLSAGGGFTRTGIGTLVDMDSLEIEVDVAEARIGEISAGMRCEGTLDAYPEWKIPAHVIAVIPSADRGKATVRVRVGLEKKDLRLQPEMGIRISFISAQPKVDGSLMPAGVAVPVKALVQRNGRSVLYLVSQGLAHERAVTPLRASDGALQVVRGEVAVNDVVVLSPPAEMKDGAAVNIEAATK